MKIKKYVLVLVMMLVVLLSCVGCGADKDKKGKEEKPPYEVVLDNYFNGIVEGDYDKYIKVFPKFMPSYDDIDEDFMEDMVDEFEDEYGANLKVSYEIKNKEEINEEDLENVEKYISYRYDEDVEITGGYELKVTATIKGEDDEDTNSQKMYIYNIDGNWNYLSLSPNTAESYVNSKEKKD